MITDALRRLGAISTEYADLARDYARVADEAAQAEATHRRERAKAIVWQKNQGEKISMAEAEVRAEADEHVSGLYLERLVKAAAADAARARLHQLREQVAVGRSFAAADREADRITATTGNGP